MSLKGQKPEGHALSVLAYLTLFTLLWMVMTLFETEALAIDFLPHVLFIAKMSAAATAAVVPMLLAGWVAQRQLVTGLMMEAVK